MSPVFVSIKIAKHPKAQTSFLSDFEKPLESRNSGANVCNSLLYVSRMRLRSYCYVWLCYFILPLFSAFVYVICVLYVSRYVFIYVRLNFFFVQC